MDPFYIAPDVEDRIVRDVTRLRIQQQSIASRVTEDAARYAVALTRQSPNASPMLVGASAMEGIPAEAVEQMAQDDDGGWSFSGLVGNVTDFVADRAQDAYEQVIKPVIRSAFTLSEGLAQEIVQRPLTAALAVGQSEATSFRQAYNDYGDSALLNIAQGDLDTSAEGGILGQGFFSGGQAQAESDNERTLTIDGKAATLGRALPTTQFAGHVFGNDSFAYNLAAGVGQFAFDVVADPMAGGLGAAAKGAKALRTIDASQAATAMKRLGSDLPLGAVDDLDALLTQHFGFSRMPSGGGGGREGVLKSFRHATDSDPTGVVFKSEGRPAWRLMDYGTKGEDGVRRGVDGSRHLGVTGRELGEEPIATAYRAVSLDEYESIMGGGFIKSNETKTIAIGEGTNAAHSPRDAASYLPPGSPGVILEIEVHPDDEWFAIGADSYLRTRKAIPMERIKGASPVMQKDGGRFSVVRDIPAEFGAVQGGGRASALIEELVPKLANREVLSALAKADAFDIVKSWKHSAANSLDDDLLYRLHAAKDEDAVAKVLLDAAQQKKVTEKGFYSGMFAKPRREVRDWKIAGTSARGTIHHDNIPDAIDKLDTWLRQAKVGQDDRRTVVNEMADVLGMDVAEQADAFEDVVKRAVGIGDDGMREELDAVSEFYSKFAAEKKWAREYGIDMAGEIIDSPINKIDPVTGAPLPTAQLIAELADGGFTLPDVTAVRRAAKRKTQADRLYASKGWGDAAAVGRWATRDLFKPLAILRPAYIVRIGLEEQMRLAAMGYDSILTHPLRFIQANIMAKGVDESFSGFAGDFARDAETMGAVQRRAYADLVGEEAKETNWVFSGNWDQMTKPPKYDKMYGTWWRRELKQLAASPEARWFARNGYDLDGFKDWARNSADGRKVIERIERASRGRGKLLTNDENLRKYGESIAVRIASKAGGELGEGNVIRSLGDQDLLDAIANDAMKGFRLDGKFDRGPQTVKFETRAKNADREQGRLNAVVDGLFEKITSRPTNSLARYPAFRQGYIKFASESMDAISSNELREEFVGRIVEMLDLTKKEARVLAKSAVGNSGKTGFYDDLTELDEVIKLRAAQETKDLLFDATKRSNMQEAYEVALPFFDAWAEVTTTWARLIKENPGFFIKAMQGLDSARQSGTVYANDFGEEVFAYPGGGMLSKFFDAGDSSVRLEGRLQGANLVAQGVGPGFGPVVQWGVGAFLPDNRELQALREWVAPFGTNGVEKPSDLLNPIELAEGIIPAWAEKVYNALGEGKVDPVQWNSTMGDVAKILAEGGAYDPADPDDQQRLLEDARKGAKTILMARAFTQGVGITGASATWQVKTDGDADAIPTDWDPEVDPDGKYHSIGVMAQEYRRLREHYNFDDDIAASVFVDMYGVDPFHISQAKTKSLANLPVDEEGNFWIKDHAAEANKYSSVIGYFVPPSADGEEPPLDYAIYRGQIRDGDRQSLTAQQQVQLANQVKARAMRDAVKRRVEGLPSSAKTEVMAKVNAVLEEQYPGWQAPVLGVAQALTTSKKIDQLKLAVNDPALADAPVTATLKAYLKVRDAVVLMQGDRGLTVKQVSSAAKASDLREALMSFGMQLQQQDKAFAGVWSRLLVSEVRE